MTPGRAEALRYDGIHKYPHVIVPIPPSVSAHSPAVFYSCVDTILRRQILLLSLDDSPKGPC